MPDEFEINAVPELRTVTPGAEVTYLLDEKLGGPKLSSVTARWFAINDPKVVTFFRPEKIPGPAGTEWENARWSVPGHHRIVCRVARAGVVTDYTYEQWVVPLGAALVGGPRLPREEADPDVALDSASRFVEVLRAVAAKSPPQNAKDKEAFEKQLGELEQYRDKLRERLESTKNFRKHPIDAEHFDAKTQKRTKLRVFISKVAFKKWILVDWTNPMVRAATGEYEGFGETSADAIAAALKDWDEDNRYPEGGITFKIPKVLDFAGQTGNFETDGSAYWDSVSSFFSWVGLGAAVVAGLVTLVAPVPGSQVVSAAIWTSIFSSTAAAVINIGTRVDEGFSSWQANAFDLLAIVGNLFGATGVVWSRGANVLVNRGDKVVKFCLIGAVTTDGVQGVMLGAEHFARLEAIQNDPTLRPDQRTNKILELFRSALVDGLLIYVSVKGTKTDLDNLNLRNRSDGTTPKERLENLTDPKKTIDLSSPKPPAAEGTAQAKPKEHVTKVNPDQEMQVPAPTGHPNRKRPPNEKKKPKGPQTIDDLDQLFKDAEVAHEELGVFTRKMASEMGGTPIVPDGVKGRPRAELKVKVYYGGDASRLFDLARATISFDSMAKIRACVAKIQSVAKVLKTNDRFARPLSGYRDVQLQIKMSNGHVAELQIHLDALIKVKDGPGHKFYEEIRDIRDAALDQGRKLTAAEQKKVLELEAEMQKLYDAAFAPFAGD